MASMAATNPGRNDPCPCGSGRKFKHCCLERQTAEDSARLRLRGAEGRVVDTLMEFTLKTWGPPLIAHAWEDFWVYDDVPDDMPSTPEFDTMFMPWLVLGFIPDPEADDAQDDWPTQPIGLEWLATRSADISDLDRAYIETACRSPLSVLVVEKVTPQRTLDLKDVLTGKRFHVLEQGASQRLRPADLLFTRVLTLESASIMIGASPFIVPPRWHTHIIDWRERVFRKRLMRRRDLDDFEVEIREMYFQIAAELLNPTPPRLSNTDGDPLALTTLTYELNMTVAGAFESLAPLARVHGEDHIDEISRDESGAITGAVLSWVKSGNRQHKDWDNTILGTLRLSAGRLVAEVNSAPRADRVKREIAKRMPRTAVLVDTTVIDPSEVLAERQRERASGTQNDDSPRETPPELRAVEEDLLRHHWEQWLDTRVPALGNKTPRQAVRSATGRERLEALLAGFGREAEGGGGSAAPDVAFIRERLGLPKSV
jgi:SEC-C motif